MRRFVGCSLFAVFALTVCFPPGQARAQFSQPGRINPLYRPPVSPYLNLLRRGSDPAINYYGLVRPEIEFRSGLQSLQQQVNTVGQDVNAQDQALGLLPETGHPTQFFNTSHYFTGLNGAAGAAAPRAAARPPTPAPGGAGRAPNMSSGGIRPPAR